VVLLLGVPSTGGCGAISSSNGSAAGPWDGQSPDGTPTGLPNDANACTPGSAVQSFVPNGTYRSANPVVGACTLDQINQYFAACFGESSSPAQCAMFKQASINTTCSSCILTSSTAPAYGPLVSTGALVQNNVAGCIELTQPSLFSCAESVQALSACEVAACAANCPVNPSEPSTQAAYNACAAAADADGCAHLFPAPCLGVTDPDAGVYLACLATSFAEFYNYAVPIFCGPNALPPPPPPEDGSTEDASAADAESGPLDAASLDASPNDGAAPDAERGDAAQDAGSTVIDAARADAGVDATVASEDAGTEGDASSAVSEAGSPPDGAAGDD
jgi:hypothetical protein